MAVIKNARVLPQVARDSRRYARPRPTSRKSRRWIAGVQHIEGVRLDIGKHRDLDRQVGLHDRRQPMRVIDQHSGGVERDALMGHQPIPTPHRLRERPHR